MRANLNLLLVTCALALVLAGCATNEENLSTEQQLYERAQQALDRRNWSTAVSSLELLEENFPFGTFGEQAQLELIYAHYQAGDYELAIANADRFIRLHPQHRNADYAYYMRGLASFNKESSLINSFFGTDNASRDPGAAINAFTMLSDFVTRFPGSDHATDARLRMVYLRNLLARGEINVANYYFSRHAYLAAGGRGRYVVENYQGSPAVPDGLATMIQSYHLLGQDDLAEKSITVLKENYPDYPALKEDGTFNYKYASQLDSRNWMSYLTLGLFNKQLQIGFDTREQYNSMHFKKGDAPLPNEF